MGVQPKVLAEDIKLAVGQADQKTSDETIGLATAILGELTENGLVNLLPPFVTGDAPPTGGPLLQGKAVQGKLVGMTPPSLTSRMQGEMGFPFATPQLTQMASGIVSHFLSSAQIIFKPNGIVGPCTNTAINPGTLTGAGGGGNIAGLVPGTLADLMSAGLGPGATPEMKAVAAAIVKHIHTFAVASFPSGFVFAVCAPGGGPISGGTGNGGKVA